MLDLPVPQLDPSQTYSIPWDLPGYIFWIFLVLQIGAYPVLAAMVERQVHGATSSSRTVVRDEDDDTRSLVNAVEMLSCTKIYQKSFLRRLLASGFRSWTSRPEDEVVAVNRLTLRARRGQILVLLGANGSGKSTTLEAVAGRSRLTSGSMVVDESGGLGVTPQNHVFWDQLTVREHLEIFNRLKAPRKPATKREISDMVKSIGLECKADAASRTLSGGQKRKLQLGMMLTGGSAVCCVDEVSSGLDPLSRRKLWDILLAERGKRTIIMTTHFLDEADLLADHIAIMSKGTLRAEGSSVQLKHHWGGGYRVHVGNTGHEHVVLPCEGEEVRVQPTFEAVVYEAATSTGAAKVMRQLNRQGIDNFAFSGPTIEDVFLRLAEEAHDPTASEAASAEEGPAPRERMSTGTEDTAEKAKTAQGTEVHLVRQVSYLGQFRALYWKRCVLFKRNWMPLVAAFLVPVVAAVVAKRYAYVSLSDRTGRPGPELTCGHRARRRPVVCTCSTRRPRTSPRPGPRSGLRPALRTSSRGPTWRICSRPST